MTGSTSPPATPQVRPAALDWVSRQQPLSCKFNSLLLLLLPLPIAAAVRLSGSGKGMMAAVYNPLAWSREAPVRVPVNTSATCSWTVTGGCVPFFAPNPKPGSCAAASPGD